MSDLNMVRGNTKEWDAIVKHPATKLPIDLVGTTVRFMAKRSFEDLDADAIIDVSSPGDILIANPTTLGAIHVKIPSSQTLVLENDNVKLWYELRVRIVGNSEWTVERGALYVSPAVILT
jgi:hypothetical protein